MPLEPVSHGLLARAPEYEPLRAFSQGGRYWDRVPQQLIRTGGLAEFLPPVETEEDDRGKYGRFFRTPGKADPVGRSRPLGRRGIPRDQLLRLRQALEQFKQQAGLPGVQPQNREFIERFQLPDLGSHPELYRLAGPWWNRHLEILWGCERTRDSSLPAAVAASKLRGDPWYHLRRLLTALLLLLLLLLPLWWLASNWDRLRKSPEQATDQRATDNTNAANNPALRKSPAANPKPKTAPRLPARPGAPDPKAAVACQIVLVNQSQPDADGNAEVTLEVRTSTKPVHPVPVESWHADELDIPSQDRLHSTLKTGDHTVKAVILDDDGKPVTLSAVVTVVSSKTITTPGKVSVRKK